MWKKGDTFCIPSWYPYQVSLTLQYCLSIAEAVASQHLADGTSDVYLYRFDDIPMISSLGFYRTAEDDWYRK